LSRTHRDKVEAQFGPRARAYGLSPVHATGGDLDMLEQIAQQSAPGKALDLGCGAGHVAYRLSAAAREVTACDPSAEMLAQVAATARARGLKNIELCNASAEQLPFENEEFEIVASRYSAHHWAGFEQGLREARRVLKHGATAVFIDAVSPGLGVLDSHLQSIELLRDISHVRDYTMGEWLCALERADFGVTSVGLNKLRIDYPSWIERMQTPGTLERAVKQLQMNASNVVAEYFKIEADGSFLLDTVFIEAVAR